MSKEYLLKIETDNHFNPGDCYECPLFVREDGHWSHYDDEYIEGNEYCILRKDGENCPMKENED